MKRGIFAGYFLLMLLCSGCQKTPDKEAVVSKVGGINNDVIIEELSDGKERTVDIPSTWTETEKKNDGQVTISVDLSLEPPKILNTPVIEMANKEFTEKDLKELVTYFADGEKVYEPQEKTKSELEVIKARIDNKESIFSDPSMFSYYKKYSSYLAEMILQAPDEKSALKEADVEFNIEKSKLWLQSREALGDKREDSQAKDRFRAMIGEKGEASVRAFCYNKNSGTTSNFVYQRGTIFSDSTVRDIEENNESSLTREGNTSYYATTYKPQLDAFREAVNGEGHDEEQGRQNAQKLLENLDIQNMSLYNAEPGVWIDNEDLLGSFYFFDDLWDFEWSKSKPGHLYKFATDINGLLADYKSGLDYDTPEDSYAPPFGVETVEIFVTEDGVQSFEWSNMAKEVKTVAKNTELLDFDKIKEKLYDHLFYIIASSTSQQNGEGVATYNYDILNGRLGYTYAPAFGSPEHAWLVPTWFFSVRKTVETGGIKWKEPTEYVMVNALDGGYISPNYAVISGQNG